MFIFQQSAKAKLSDAAAVSDDSHGDSGDEIVTYRASRSAVRNYYYLL